MFWMVLRINGGTGLFLAYTGQLEVPAIDLHFLKRFRRTIVSPLIPAQLDLKLGADLSQEFGQIYESNLFLFDYQHVGGRGSSTSPPP